MKDLRSVAPLTSLRGFVHCRWAIPGGKSLWFIYRVIIRNGDFPASEINENCRQYASGK